MRYLTLIYFLCISLALFLLSCEGSQKVSPLQDERSKSSNQERLSIPYDASLFDEFPIDSKFQYYELLSYKEQPLVPNPSIQDYDENITYKICLDRSCVMCYDHEESKSTVFQSFDKREKIGLNLEANNPEFDKLTIPISVEDGILFYDGVEGVEIYKQIGESYKKTWTHLYRDAQAKPSTSIIYNIPEKRIEYFDKDSGNILVKTINFYDDDIKTSVLNHGAKRITYLPSANLYLSIFEDYFLLHNEIPTEEREEDLKKFKLPYYPGEMAIFNNQNIPKDLSLKFGHEIDLPEIGSKTDKLNGRVIRGVYTHKSGLNAFSINGDKMVAKTLPLKENEAKTSRLFATKDFVGSVIYDSNTPGQYSNETKISNLRLLIYSFISDELLEVPMPKSLQIEYDVVTIEDVLYLFNEERYYKFDLSYDFSKMLNLVKSNNSSTSF